MSADKNLIEAARQCAATEHTIVNTKFREWLEDYVQRQRQADEAMAFIEELRKTVRTGGRKFTRDEMNER